MCSPNKLEPCPNPFNNNCVKRESEMKRETQLQTAWGRDITGPLLRGLSMSLVFAVTGLFLAGTASAVGKLKGQVLGGCTCYR